jgi:hypothetical protein
MYSPVVAMIPSSVTPVYGCWLAEAEDIIAKFFSIEGISLLRVDLG